MQPRNPTPLAKFYLGIILGAIILVIVLAATGDLNGATGWKVKTNELNQTELIASRMVARNTARKMARCVCFPKSLPHTFREDAAYQTSPHKLARALLRTAKLGPVVFRTERGGYPWNARPRVLVRLDA